MKKTLFLSAILATALCSSAFGAVNTETITDATVTVPGYTGSLSGTTNIVTSDAKQTNLTATQPEAAVTILAGNDTRYLLTDAAVLANAGTIVLAPSTVEGHDATQAAQLFLDAAGAGKAVALSNDIIIGASPYDERNYNGALRFSAGNYGVTLSGNLTLVDNALFTVQGGNKNTTISGKLIADEGKVLTCQQGGLLILSGDLSDFNGTLASTGSYIQIGSGASALQLASGSNVTFSAGKISSATKVVISGTLGNAAGILGEGASRFAAAKNGDQVTLKAGSEQVLSSLSTTGTNGGYIILEAVGDTAHNLYTSFSLNGTGGNNDLIVAAANATTHIGALSGVDGADVRGDYGQGGDRVLHVHQDTNTTFAGIFQASTADQSSRSRHVALIKDGTGTLTLTGANASTKDLTVRAGGVTFSGSGKWAGAITVEANGTLTYTVNDSNIGAVTNNGIVNLAVNEESTTYVRTENGYNGTQKVVTLGGTGALSGTGMWQVDGVNANRENRTLTAVTLDETKYYVDKANATYDSALASKYVVAEGKELTVSGSKTNVKTLQNDGTLVLSGMSGYFAASASLGNVKLVGADALTLTDGYSYDRSGSTKIANLSGTGTIATSGDKAPNERFEISGTVASTISFNGAREENTRTGSVTTFAFTKADIENVTIADITNSRATLNFEAKALTVNSLTLNSGTVGVYAIGAQHTEANEVTLTTSSLTVNGNANLNANLVVSGGTMSFANNTLLTMGSSVSIGEGDTVTVELTEEMVQAIKDTGRVDLFTSVETATLGSHIVFTGTNGAALEQADVYALQYDGSKIYVTPEPATATLSLLALAALASRRKRH